MQYGDYGESLESRCCASAGRGAAHRWARRASGAAGVVFLAAASKTPSCGHCNRVEWPLRASTRFSLPAWPLHLSSKRPPPRPTAARRTAGRMVVVFAFCAGISALETQAVPIRGALIRRRSHGMPEAMFSLILSYVAAPRRPRRRRRRVRLPIDLVGLLHDLVDASILRQ